VAISSASLPRVYPFTVKLDEGDGGLPREGHVNCSQLLTIDQARLEEYVGTLPARTMELVADALRYELDL
jgi:mRNA-degrading endonuclease toxin of MazEF toxin-antitoxin module